MNSGRGGHGPLMHNIGKRERSEMYLKAILMLGQETPPVTGSKVAEFMGVSPPSAFEMLKRMEQQGLVESSSEAGVTLTDSGMLQARRLVRRMRLAECLLSNVLHLPLPAIYDEACKLEHALSDVVEASLAEALGHPETCPHGFPIPSLEGRVGCPLLETADGLEPGAEVVVISVPERNAELLTYLVDQGVRPGATLKFDESAPFNGPVFVHVSGKRLAIAREALAGVRVQRDAALSTALRE